MGTLLEGNFIFIMNSISKTAFAVQSVELPAVTLTERLNTNYGSVDYSTPGEKLIYDKLNLQFLVDENLDNFNEVLDWMNGIVEPNKGELNTDLSKTDDGVLMVLNKKKKIVKTYRFHNCFPTTVGPVSFNTTSAENSSAVSLLSLAYSHYTCEQSKVTDKEISVDNIEQLIQDTLKK